MLSKNALFRTFGCFKLVLIYILFLKSEDGSFSLENSEDASACFEVTVYYLKYSKAKELVREVLSRSHV